MPEPRDQMPAAVGRGHLQACHADREQVIGRLKAAFVQGRLLKDELDARVGQAQAARTYADLATLIADLPAGLAAAEPPYQPARARAPRPVRTSPKVSRTRARASAPGDSPPCRRQTSVPGVAQSRQRSWVRLDLAEQWIGGTPSPAAAGPSGHRRHLILNQVSMRFALAAKGILVAGRFLAGRQRKRPERPDTSHDRQCTPRKEFTKSSAVKSPG